MTTQLQPYTARQWSCFTRWTMVAVSMLMSVCYWSLSAQARPYEGMTLRIDLSPAKCALQPQRAKLRQCREGFPLTVSGLRPEPATKEVCSQRKANLPPLQTKVISRIMPDKVIRDLAWQKYGSCMTSDAKGYFRLIAKLSGQLKVPKELSSGNHYEVNRLLFTQALVKKNAGLARQHIQLSCQKMGSTHSQVLTELQVCYDSVGKFSNCQRTVKVSCPASFTIKGLP